PVSLLYILSMAIGYIGLRYIELSVSTPICNSSGALVAIITIVTRGIGDMSPWQIVAIFMVAAGIILLGVTEANEDDELRAKRQAEGNYKYAKSVLALLLPIIYCILDAAGTFADSIVLETLNEDSANVAYELTFLVAGIFSAIYVLGIKREHLVPKLEIPKYIGACFETVGQFFYIYALADTAHVALSAPIISSYCAASVLWSRIFLKEKLSRKHYFCLLLVFIGIVIMGVFDA
ncbi:MAG: EamA family transporter, partial [Clostridia bacterium]|nr:EamA family transporter [Clostridia bacterium]